MKYPVELYRILYQVNNNKIKNYHYYIAEDAMDAVSIEHRMTELKDVCNLKILSIEKWDRFQKKWIDESEIADKLIKEHNNTFRIAKETIWAKLKK